VAEKNSVEIERKYIIAMPDEKLLATLEGYTVSDITQIYLTANSGISRRVRSRRFPDRTEYTETRKRRIDAISADEEEREITADRFGELSREIASGTRPIVKRRHTFLYKAQIFEIDVYPDWTRTAIMETELTDPAARAEIPPFIEVIREVTGDFRYANAGMSRAFPEETAICDISSRQEL